MNLARYIQLQQEVRLFLALQTHQPFLEGKPAIRLFYDGLTRYNTLEKFASNKTKYIKLRQPQMILSYIKSLTATKSSYKYHKDRLLHQISAFRWHVSFPITDKHAPKYFVQLLLISLLNRSTSDSGLAQFAQLLRSEVFFVLIFVNSDFFD